MLCEMMETPTFIKTVISLKIKTPERFQVFIVNG